MTYAADRMIRPSVSMARGGRFLYGTTPEVLQLDRPPQVLILKFRRFSGPRSLGVPAHERAVCGFNPSIVEAPPHLCPRCTFVAAVRADVMHQCHSGSPLYSWDAAQQAPTGAWFKNTAIAVLDSELRVLGWTWLISRPERQIATWEPLKRSHVAPGVSDGFAPPWGNQVYDTRLVNYNGSLLATYNCASCMFSISHLQLTANILPDGGLRGVRCWATRRYTLREAWVQGRNQALFVDARGELLVQPWVGLVGAIGRPRQSSNAMPGRLHEGACYAPSPADVQRHLRRKAARGRVEASRAGRDDKRAALEAILASDRVACGTTARGGQPPKASLAPLSPLRLLLNQTSSPPDDVAGKSAALPALDAGVGRLSATANLVRARPSFADCDGFLGVGHLHRKEGRTGQIDALQRGWEQAMRTGGGRRANKLLRELNRLRIRESHVRERNRPAGSRRADHRFMSSARRFRSHDNTPRSGRGTVPRRSGSGVSGTPRRERRESLAKGSASGRRLRAADNRSSRLLYLSSGRRLSAGEEQPFAFGYEYSHFWYLLSARPPHRLIGASSEFCLGSAQDPTACESVQFLSSLTVLRGGDSSRGGSGDGDQPAGNRSLLLGFGINDCEAKTGTIAVDRVWRMLRPIPSAATPVCEPMRVGEV